MIIPEDAQVEDIIDYCDRKQLKDMIYSKGTRLAVFIVTIYESKDYEKLMTVYVVGVLKHSLQHENELMEL